MRGSFGPSEDSHRDQVDSMTQQLAAKKTPQRRPTRAKNGPVAKSRKPAKAKKPQLRVIDVGGVKVVLQKPIKRGNIPTAVIRQAVLEAKAKRAAEATGK